MNTAALLCLALVMLPALARASEPAVAPLRLTRPDQLELARRSTVGPGWEVAGGVLLVASTPIVAGFAALAAGPAWRDCDRVRAEREVCTRAAERDARRVGYGVAIPLLAVATGLVTHGGLRLARIRSARREVRLSGGSVSFRRGGAVLGVKLRF